MLAYLIYPLNPQFKSDPKINSLPNKTWRFLEKEKWSTSEKGLDC